MAHFGSIVARILGPLLILLMVAGVTDAAEEGEAVAVALVRVHLPLTGSADQALQTKLRRTRDRLLTVASQNKSDSRPLLVLELSPRVADANLGEGSQFERALSLARFLCSREMASVKTVAFLPRTVRGHGTLLALACEEIVMAPTALLGQAGIDRSDESTIHQTAVAAYREIAEVRRTIPVALAVGMIDSETEILQVETEEGIQFVLRSDLEEFSRGREIVSEKTLAPAGTMAEFDGREGRQFGFVKYLAPDRAGVAAAFDVPVESLEEDESRFTEWRPVILELRGEITPRLAGQLESLMGSTLETTGANWIGVRIDSAGGDLEASVRLATALAQLDANSVRTVAYVPAEASGGAALVALACDQLVMHPRARLLAGSSNVLPAELDAARLALRESLAPRTERSWSLLTALIDPGVELFDYRNKTTGASRIMSAAEAATLPDADAWRRGQPIQEALQPLEISGERALKLGLAWQTVESFDELKQLYSITEDPVVAQLNWALELIEALASPEFAVLLMMAGFAGIYIELRTPGLGIGGFIAAVALVLFFWSKYLHGTAGWLEVLLFVTGVAFLLLEIFVLPGFGIFGLGGGAMVIASLVLASLTFITPHTSGDMEELTRSLGSVALAGVGVVAIAMVSSRYLPQAPLFRRMVLTPPPPEERVYMEKQETVADYARLVGALGVAATHLRPAGKAEIDHRLVDVIAEAEPLDRGTPIVVVDAHGNRVVVRRASGVES